MSIMIVIIGGDRWVKRSVINHDELRRLVREANVRTRMELARGFGIDPAACTRMMQARYRSVNAETAGRMTVFFESRGLDPGHLFKGDAHEQAS